MRLRACVLARTLAMAALLAACSDGDQPLADAGVDVPTPGVDTGKLWPCDEVGKACNPHDTCAIDAVCGEDKLCRPKSRQNCDDGLPCTQDICKGMGLCEHLPVSGTCALPAPVGGGDGGPGKTEVRCFKKDERKPGEPCLLCDPDKDAKGWTSANGGFCDDGDACTKDDYCAAGVCKGTYYGTKCADAYGCTTDFCDGKGGCLESKLRSDSCLINGTCYKDKENDPAGGCKTCDVTKSQSAWTPITNTCLLDGKCYKPGDKHPLGCAECDPAVSASAWTVKGNECLIDKACKKAGEKDAIACASCDPAKNKYAWTPLPGVCKIDGVCHTSGASHPGGCAVCDPAASAISWTVKGNDCLIDNVCRKPGDKDLLACASCDPAKDKYAWSPIPGLCKIAGACFTAGAQHPGGCAVCDPAISATAWTVKGNDCLIDTLCRKPGDKDALGCGACDPAKEKYGWSPLPGLCTIDGACHASGAPHPGGCGSCDPTKNAKGWTPSGSGCLIDFACYAAGASHPAGCASCDPAKSKTSWTVSGGGCLIGSACVAASTKEPGGCGSCDPAKSATAWTRPAGCLVSHAWSRGLGGTSSDTGYGVAVDASGNVYVTGYFYNTVDFGGGVLTSAGSNDVFLASYTPSGKHRWSKRFGSTSSDYGYAVAVDGAGNVYLAGYFYGTVDFGGGALTSAGSNDIFVASYTASGQHRWSKRFGGTSSDYAYGLAVDGSGNLYLTGSFYTSIDFGGGAIAANGSSTDLYLASFTSLGAHRWSKGFGGTSSDYGYGVATDAGGNVYLTGYFYNTLSFGGASLTSAGSFDVFLASFTSAGAHRWSKNFGGTSSDYGYSVATDGSGNVVLTGYYYGTIDFGGGTLSANGTSSDIFLASFSSAGAHRFSKSFGGTSSDSGYGVATDSAGNVFVTGSFYGTIDFGAGALSANGTSSDLFIASFNTTGGLRWARAHGSTSSETGRALAVDGEGNILATGSYSAALDLGGGALPAAGGSDVYLLKLLP